MSTRDRTGNDCSDALLTPDSRATSTNTSLNDFRSSANHGIQAHAIHGNINLFQNQSQSQPFKSQNPKDALLQADAAIRKYYKSTERLEIERLSGEILSLEKCYINLALIDHSDGRKHEDKPSFELKSRLRLEARSEGQQIALKDLFEQRKLSDGIDVNPKRIFIRGRAGVGKTTLCKKIVYEHLNGRLGGKLFDRILWFPVRSLRNENKNKNLKYGWLEVLQDAFSPPPQVPDWEYLIDLMSDQLQDPDFQRKTLFLLDGLDEISRAWRREDGDGAFKFLEAVICDAPNVIITSRPHANSIKIGKFDIELETLGFTPDQVAAYIQNSVKNEQTRLDMKNLIESKPLIQGLLRIPVQLDAFCCTWSYGSQLTGMGNLSTMTTLYLSISTELWRKDLVRIKGYDKPHELEDAGVMELVLNEHRLLEVLAFQGLINNIIEFTPQHQSLIDSHFRQQFDLPLSYKYTLQQLSFLRTSDTQQHQAKKNYHFLHLTFQEFFAASYFVRHWLSDTNLTQLDLDSATSGDINSIDEELEESTSPTRFLQTRKYDSRLNIFWRFVTGLIQHPSGYQNKNRTRGSLGECRNIITFFNELDSEPRDQLGTMHRRLLMYYLSEVAPGKRRDVQDIRQQIEELLRQGTILEANSSKGIVLGKETEFPERVLLSLLYKDDHSSHEIVLSTLRARASVDIETLSVLSSFTADEFEHDIQLQAILIILENSRTESREISAQAVKTLRSTLKHKDRVVWINAANQLRRQRNWSEEAISIWTKLFKNENEDPIVRLVALHALLSQRHLPNEIANHLVELFKESDANARYEIARTLYFSLLPKNVVEALLVLLKDQDSNVRYNAVRALKCERDLSEEAIDTLIVLLTDENSDIRSEAAFVLGYQSLRLEKHINGLVPLLKDEKLHMRYDSSRVLIRGSSHLSEEIISILLTLLKDEYDMIRYQAAAVLGNQSPRLSTINALFPLLNDESFSVRGAAAEALGKQSPHLSGEIIDALFKLLKDDVSFVRRYTAEALLSQSQLSGEIFSALLALHKDEDANMRIDVARAMGSRSSHLSEEVLDMLVTLLDDKEAFVRDSAGEALERQSHLSDKTINTLLALLKNKNKEAHKVLLHHDSFFSMVKDLEIKDWLGLWSIWLDQSATEEISCYDFEGILFLRLGSTKHKITDTPEQTRRLLQALVNTRELKTHDYSSSSAKIQSESINELRGKPTKPSSKLRWRSILNIRKQK